MATIVRVTHSSVSLGQAAATTNSTASWLSCVVRLTRKSAHERRRPVLERSERQSMDVTCHVGASKCLLTRDSVFWSRVQDEVDSDPSAKIETYEHAPRV